MSNTTFTLYTDNVKLTDPVRPRVLRARIERHSQLSTINAHPDVAQSACHDIRNLVIDELEFRVTHNSVKDHHARVRMPFPPQSDQSVPTFADIHYAKMNRLNDEQLASMGVEFARPQSNDYASAETAFDTYYNHIKLSKLVDRIVGAFTNHIGRQVSKTNNITIKNIKNYHDARYALSSARSQEARIRTRLTSHMTETGDGYFRRKTTNLAQANSLTARVVPNPKHFIFSFAIEYDYTLADESEHDGLMRFVVLRDQIREINKPDDVTFRHRPDGLLYYMDGSRHGYVTYRAGVFACVRREPLDTTDADTVIHNAEPSKRHRNMWERVCDLQLWPYALAPTPSALADAPRIAWPFAFSHAPILQYLRDNADRALVLPRGPRPPNRSIPRESEGYDWMPDPKSLEPNVNLTYVK